MTSHVDEHARQRIGLPEVLRRTWRACAIYARQCPSWFAATAVSSLLVACGPYVTIWLSARLVDELAGRRDPGRLMQWTVLTLVVSAAVSLATSAAQHWKNREGATTSWSHKRILMSKMMDMDYQDVDDQRSYDAFLNVVQNDNWAGYGIRYVGYIFDDLLTAVFRILGGIALSVSLFVADVPDGSPLDALNGPACGIVFIAVMLAIVMIASKCEDNGNRLWARHAEDARFGNRVFAAFGGYKSTWRNALDLRIYRQQEQLCSPMLRGNNTFGYHSVIGRLARGPMGAWMVAARVLTVGLTAAAYLFVCLKAWGGAFGVGAVTQYVGAVTSLFAGLSALLTQVGEMRNNAEFLGTSFAFLDIPNRMYQGSLTTEKRSDRRYEVEFRDVSFRYPGSRAWALRHVNLRFRVGGRLAVVGPNGSGKTTFIKLLCRLYDPTEGEILLNGIDIRKYRYDEYMALFSVVFQDFRLLSLPLGQNVAAGVDVDRRRAVDCLGKAGFSDRLATLPKGLDTSLYRDLDKDGVEISGGEAQKIAIARALYRDAPFVILDEPTAALDPVAEAEVYARFDELVGDRTAVYISHRLSSCRFCDRIAVFDHGAVVQSGTHDELVADEGGLYHELWHAQAQYYTTPAEA